jgi:N-acetylmuramoyl-L-alanine amidase
MTVASLCRRLASACFAAPLRAGALAFAVWCGVSGLVEAAPAKPTAASPAIAAAMDVAVDGAKTRFTVTLSRPIAAKAFLMELPDRVIVDLPELTFHLPGETGRERAGVVSSFRYGLFAPGRSRIVIDLAQPALVSRIEVTPHPRDGSAVLTLELARAERDAFRRAAVDTIPGPERAAPPVADAARTAARSSCSTPATAASTPARRWPAETGCSRRKSCSPSRSASRKRLEAGGRYRVLMTRDHDVFVPLGDRVRLARAAKADLFISIHADSIAGGTEVRGLTVYTGSERASDADSARLADRENRSDALAGIDGGETADDVSDILQELTLRETRAFSHGFAGRLVSELDPVARLNKNPHRQAGFRVLRAHDIPSVWSNSATCRAARTSIS